MRLSDIIAAGIAVAVASVPIAFVVLIGSMEIRDWHKRQSVRAALRGDCVEALHQAAKAGNVPYDTYYACLREAR